MEAAIFFYRGRVLKKTSFHFLPSKEVTQNCLLPDFSKEISPTEATRLLYYFTFTIENCKQISKLTMCHIATGTYLHSDIDFLLSEWQHFHRG